MGWRDILSSIFGSKATDVPLQSPVPVPTSLTELPLAADSSKKIPRCGVVYTITSDMDGTILLPLRGNPPNIALVHFLFDAAEEGHEVIISSGGFPETTAAKLQRAAEAAGRPIPPRLEIITKIDLPVEVTHVDIAFDDDHFRYLPNKPTFEVRVQVDGTLSVSYERLRALTGTSDSPHAQTAAPPAATAVEPKP